MASYAGFNPNDPRLCHLYDLELELYIYCRERDAIRHRETSGVIEDEYKSADPMVYPPGTEPVDPRADLPRVKDVKCNPPVKFEEPQPPEAAVVRCKEPENGRIGPYPVVRTNKSRGGMIISPDPSVTAPVSALSSGGSGGMLGKYPPDGRTPGFRQPLERITEKSSSEAAGPSGKADHPPIQGARKPYRAGLTDMDDNDNEPLYPTISEHKLGDDPVVQVRILPPTSVHELKHDRCILVNSELKNMPTPSAHNIDDDVCTLVKSRLHETHNLKADPKVAVPSIDNFVRRKEV
jgi:hypothetical protein